MIQNNKEDGFNRETGVQLTFRPLMPTTVDVPHR